MTRIGWRENLRVRALVHRRGIARGPRLVRGSARHDGDWNRVTVQPFLDVRAAVLNDTLEDAFRHRYPGFRPANDDKAVALAS